MTEISAFFLSLIMFFTGLSGKEEVENYYRIAPPIVAAINKLPEVQNIWEKVYDELVAYCVELIKSDKLNEAYQRYKEYSLKLQREYC